MPDFIKIDKVEVNGDGKQCSGSGVDTKDCNSQNCPIHGGWGEWGSLGGMF